MWLLQLSKDYFSKKIFFDIVTYENFNRKRQIQVIEGDSGTSPISCTLRSICKVMMI